VERAQALQTACAEPGRERRTLARVASPRTRAEAHAVLLDPRNLHVHPLLSPELPNCPENVGVRRKPERDLDLNAGVRERVVLDGALGKSLVGDDEAA